jgi:two-component system chemotaxis response regulator CheB
MGDTVRVFIASDNSTDLSALVEIIGDKAGYDLAGIAKTQNSMIGGLSRNQPDVLLFDVDSFCKDPVECIRDIMRLAPVPIVLFAAESTGKVVGDCILAGALAVIKKSPAKEIKPGTLVASAILKTLKAYAGVKVIRHIHGGPSSAYPKDRTMSYPTSRIVAIASSTGGPLALKTVLSGLPTAFPAGIVVAQHITQGFTQGLVEWLDKMCGIKIKEGKQDEQIRRGNAYFAPDGFHISVSPDETVILDNKPNPSGHRPSCNALLSSVAESYGNRAIGVILSGMGDDGAKGLKMIHEAGGLTFAQDEESCVVFGMPRVALEIGAVRVTTPLDRIAWEILRELR